MSTVAKSFSDFRLIRDVAVTEVLSVSVYTGTLKRFAIKSVVFSRVPIMSFTSCSFGLNSRDLSFSYKQEVPYYDRKETLFSTTSRSFLASYGRCAVQCIEDLSCNALELCRVPGGSECRATTGLLKTQRFISIF